MCTLALYFGVFDNAPLLVAANRDEHYDRPSAEPSSSNTSPKILAGRDLRAGGTWLGVNEYGLVVGILNRRVNGDQLPQATLRSRGLLCMDLLAHKSAAAAAAFIAAHDSLYNPFTVMFADRGNAFAAYNDGDKIATRQLDVGLHVFSSAAEGESVRPRPSARARNSLKRSQATARVAGSQAGSPHCRKCWRITPSKTAQMIPATPSACIVKTPARCPRVSCCFRKRTPDLKCFTVPARPAKMILRT